MCLKSITDFLSLEYPEVLIRKKKWSESFKELIAWKGSLNLTYGARSIMLR